MENTVRDGYWFSMWFRRCPRPPPTSITRVNVANGASATYSWVTFFLFRFQVSGFRVSVSGSGYKDYHITAWLVLVWPTSITRVNAENGASATYPGGGRFNSVAGSSLEHLSHNRFTVTKLGHANYHVTALLLQLCAPAPHIDHVLERGKRRVRQLCRFKSFRSRRSLSSSLAGPVDPSFRVLSGRLKSSVRLHTFNQESLFSEGGVLLQRSGYTNWHITASLLLVWPSWVVIFHGKFSREKSLLQMRPTSAWLNLRWTKLLEFPVCTDVSALKLVSVWRAHI